MSPPAPGPKLWLAGAALLAVALGLLLGARLAKRERALGSAADYGRALAHPLHVIRPGENSTAK